MAQELGNLGGVAMDIGPVGCRRRVACLRRGLAVLRAAQRGGWKVEGIESGKAMIVGISRYSLFTGARKIQDRHQTNGMTRINECLLPEKAMVIEGTAFLANDVHPSSPPVCSELVCP